MESLREIFNDYAKDYNLDFNDLQAFTERADILGKLTIFDYLQMKYEISASDMELIKVVCCVGDLAKQVKLKTLNQNRKLSPQYAKALESQSVRELLGGFFTDEQLQAALNG